MEKNTKKNPKKELKIVKDTLENKTSEILKETQNISISEILNNYIKTYVHFKIYLKNELLFDTKVTLRKNYPFFNKNDFNIGENKYIYRGIRIELY